MWRVTSIAVIKAAFYSYFSISMCAVRASTIQLYFSDRERNGEKMKMVEPLATDYGFDARFLWFNDTGKSVNLIF